MRYLLSFWRNVSSCCPHCSTKFSMAFSFPELNVGVSMALTFFQCCPFMFSNIFSVYGEFLILSVGRSTKWSKSRTIISLMSSGSRTIKVGQRPSKKPIMVYWIMCENLKLEVLMVVKMVTVLLGCDALYSCRYLPMFWSNFCPEHEGDTFLWIDGNHQQDCAVSHTRRPQPMNVWEA